MVALLIEQVKLQFAGHDRVIALGLERIDDLDQQVARVSDSRWHAFSRVHAHLQRRCRNLPPG
ncbi:hypothetical protein D3C80_2134730 [compost metagenome]